MALPGRQVCVPMHEQRSYRVSAFDALQTPQLYDFTGSTGNRRLVPVKDAIHEDAFEFVPPVLGSELRHAVLLGSCCEGLHLFSAILRWRKLRRYNSKIYDDDLPLQRYGLHNGPTVHLAGRRFTLKKQSGCEQAEMTRCEIETFNDFLSNMHPTVCSNRCNRSYG